jgi:tRNA pseudouridine38-40 synthase
MQITRSSKFALGIEYCGKAYHGWQSQAGAIDTIQTRVEQALGIVADQEISVICAGRTDTGVHASFQVVHFESIANRKSKAWIFGTNSHLPNDISVQWSKSVAPDFHARYSATARKYTYLIYNHNVRSSLYADNMTRESRPLDEVLMDGAGLCLLGENDFTSFRAAGCQSKTPIRNVMSLHVRRQARFVIIEIVANAFLQHMVRNIAGLLMDIGAGEKDPSEAQAILQTRDRTKSSKTAAPDGLYLSGISYPSRFEIPAPITNTVASFGLRVASKSRKDL